MQQRFVNECDEFVEQCIKGQMPLGEEEKPEDKEKPPTRLWVGRKKKPDHLAKYYPIPYNEINWSTQREALGRLENWKLKAIKEDSISDAEGLHAAQREESDQFSGLSSGIIFCHLLY